MLVAYVVTAAGAEFDPTALRAELARRLPDYMVPSRIVALDRLPLTPNGKLDRAALPEPAPLAEGLSGPSRPLTPTETVVAEIWAKALSLPAIPPDRNFFEAGANSLTALRVLTALGAAFPERSPTIADIFNNQSVETLAAALTADAVGTAQVVRLRATGDRPMLYCFPGLMVNTREYAPLVRRLGPDQPVTGFVCYSLTDARKSVVSVEDIAARYAEIIEKESAGRPCTMLGWSWGGVLAYEAARMLGSRIDLSFVGMLDVCDIDVSFAVGALPVLTPEHRRHLQGDRRVLAGALADEGRLGGPVPAHGPGTPRAVPRLCGGRPRSATPRRAGRRQQGIRTLDLRRQHAAVPPLPGGQIRLPDPGLACRPLGGAWPQPCRLGRYSNRVEQVTVIPDVTHREIVDSTMFHDSFAASL